MNRCPDLAIEGIDNLNVDDLDDAHALLSAEGQECDGELQECDGNARATRQRDKRGAGGATP